MHWIDFHQMMSGNRSLVSGTGAIWLLLLLLCPLSSAFGQSSTDTTQIHVRLHHQANIESVELTVKEGTFDVQLPSGGAPVHRLRSGETTTFGVRQSDVFLRRGEIGLYAESLHLKPTQDATWSLSLNGEDASHTYTGGLRLAPQENNEGLVLINSVPLTDYVASVVASEYGLDDQEGAKAMAVVARTYALFSSKTYEGDYDHVDGTASQVYSGADVITGSVRRAARETRGQILTYEGDPIQAVYFSSSGGHTANNEDVWKTNEALPYLRGKEDPYDSQSPHHRWTATVNRSSLLRALTRHEDASVEGFLIDARSQEGRVTTLELLLSNGPRTQIRANDFRLAINKEVDGRPLKSTWFEATRQGNEYVFEGRGFGHGVGLNQWGAHAMAQQGKSYREILSFYYTGVDIERLEGVQFAPPVAPAAQDAPSQTDTTSRRVGW